MIYRDIIPNQELEALAQSMNYRAKMAGVAGKITMTGLRDRILSCEGRCQWCDVSVVEKPIEVDHIISLNQGGGNVAENLVVSCPACNRRKGAKNPYIFACEIKQTSKTVTPFVQYMFLNAPQSTAIQLSLFDMDDDDR